MSVFEFTTDAIDAGYGKDGFFAFGTTTSFKFDPSLWGYDPYPAIRPFKLDWRIDTAGECQWKYYAYCTSAADAQLTARQEAIKELSTGPLVGLFWRPYPDENTITLRYSLPADPSLAAFVMGVIGAGRSLDFCCLGFQFRNGDDDKAFSPTANGWTHRREPHFMRDQPILRVK